MVIITSSTWGGSGQSHELTGPEAQRDKYNVSVTTGQEKDHLVPVPNGHKVAWEKVGVPGEGFGQ